MKMVTRMEVLDLLGIMTGAFSSLAKEREEYHNIKY